MIDPTMYQGDPEMLREAMGIAARRMNPDVEAARGQVEALQGQELFDPSTQALRDARESWAEDRAMMSDGLAAGQQALNIGIGRAGAPNLYAGRGDTLRDQVQQQNQSDVANLMNARTQAQGALQAAQSSDLAERGDMRAGVEFGMRVDDRDQAQMERIRMEDPDDPRARALQAQYAAVFPFIPPQEFEGKGLADLELEKPFFERRQQLEMEHRAARARAAAQRRQMAAAQMDMEQKLAIAMDAIAKRDPDMRTKDPALFRATAQQLANNDKAMDRLLQGQGGAGQIKTAGGTFMFTGEKEDPTTRKEVGTRVSATNAAMQAGREILDATREYTVLDMATDKVGRSNAADKFIQARERFVTNALKARGQNPDKDSNAYKALMEQIGDIRTKGVALGIVDPSGPLTNALRTLPVDTADFARAQGYEPPPNFGAMPEQQAGQQSPGGKAPPKRRAAARRRTSTIVEFADGSRREVPNSQLEQAAAKPGARVWEGY